MKEEYLPNGWKETTIGEFAPLQRGFDLPNRLRIDGKYPVVYSNGIVNFHRDFQVKGPGVVTGRSGTIGKVHYVEDDYWPHNTALWVKEFNDAKPKYVFYLYTYIGFNQFTSGSGVPTLNRNDAHSYKIYVPKSQLEQTAIANVLSDVDALIAALEKLINKKSAIKTAAMQQLLTGKKRLPPFDKLNTGYKQTELGEIPGDWDVKTISQTTSNIIDYRGVTPKKLGMDWGGDIVALSAGNVKKGYIDFESESYFGSEELYKRWMRNGDVKKGDIVFTMEAPLGNVALIPDNRKYILSQRTVLLQFDEKHICTNFLFQYFLSDEFQSLINDRATGSTAQGIKRATFELINLKLPSIEEQDAIGQVLSDMDKDLEALKQRLHKTQQIKQGMMQELLTGKTRLVKPQGEPNA